MQETTDAITQTFMALQQTLWLRQQNIGVTAFAEPADLVVDWRNYVPEEIVAVWDTLTERERMLICMVANVPAQRENWDW